MGSFEARFVFVLLGYSLPWNYIAYLGTIFDFAPETAVFVFLDLFLVGFIRLDDSYCAFGIYLKDLFWAPYSEDITECP